MLQLPWSLPAFGLLKRFRPPGGDPGGTVETRGLLRATTVKPAPSTKFLPAGPESGGDLQADMEIMIGVLPQLGAQDFVL